MIIRLLRQPSGYLLGWFLLTSMLVGAQPLRPAWQRTFGGASYENVYALTATSSEAIGMAGVTYSRNGSLANHHGNADYWVAKLDGSGQPLWQQTLGGSQDEHARAIKSTTDGGFVVAGYTYSSDGQVSGHHGGADYWVVRLSETGDILWQKTLGGTSDDLATAITATPDGGFLVAGYTESNDGQINGNHGQQDGWLVKLSGAGEILWQKTLGGSGRETITAITTTTDDGFTVAGSTESTDGAMNGLHGGRDYWVVRLNQSGDILWQKTLGGTKDDFATAITPTNDGQFVIAGYTYSNDSQVSGNHGERDYWVVRLDQSGDLLWQRTLGGTKDDFASALATVDGGFVVAGYTYSNDGQVGSNAGRADSWVVRLNEAGELLGQQTLGSRQDERAYALLPLKGSHFLVAGFAQAMSDQSAVSSAREDGWIVKMAPSNEETATDVAQTGRQWQATLLGNPIKEGRVAVEVRGASGQPLYLRVSNLQGRLVAEHHIDGAGEVERHSFDVGSQPMGVLLLQVASPQQAQTLKFLKAD